MKHQYNDGGRKASGYKGQADDCVVRAIAIAAKMDYQDVYDYINQVCATERRTKKRKTRSSARTGTYKATTKRIIEGLGWEWTPTMFVGQGCKVHLKEDELPKGRLIVSVSQHLVAVIDGVIHDTYDCSRNGTRCVYGYWQEN